MLKYLVGAVVALGLITSPALAQNSNSPYALINKVKSQVKAVNAAATSANPVQSILQLGTQLQQFTLSDLQAAQADAAAQVPADTRHGPCWAALATVVSNQNLNGVLPAGLGAAQLIQKTFDLQSTFEGHQAWKDQIATACALTVADLATDLNTLLAKAGLGAVNTAIVLPKL